MSVQDRQVLGFEVSLRRLQKGEEMKEIERGEWEVEPSRSKQHQLTTWTYLYFSVFVGLNGSTCLTKGVN